MHTFDKKYPDDFISYGVKFENMRKKLILRAPFTITNLTDVTY